MFGFDNTRTMSGLDAQGNWTYQLCVSVDDMRQRVDLVIRGEDLLPSTGRQILLATRLGPAAEVRFLGDLASGALTPLAVESIDWLRIAERDGRFPAAALAGLGPHRADQVALSA